jgi:hypothetical protein
VVLPLAPAGGVLLGAGAGAGAACSLMRNMLRVQLPPQKLRTVGSPPHGMVQDPVVVKLHRWSGQCTNY